MKKLLLFTLAFLSPFFAKGQDVGNIVIPFDDNIGKYYYSFVHPVAPDLIDHYAGRIHGFLVKKYGDKSTSDNKGTDMFFAGKSIIAVSDNLIPATLRWAVDYDVSIQFKENRYRIYISNIKILDDISGRKDILLESFFNNTVELTSAMQEAIIGIGSKKARAKMLSDAKSRNESVANAIDVEIKKLHDQIIDATREDTEDDW